MRKIRKKQKIYFPDPKFNEPLVSRFINHLMKNGKKNLAYKIFYNAMDKIDSMNSHKENNKKTALEIWKEGLSNVMPHVEVRHRRMGGTNIQIPVPISSNNKITKSIKLLITCASRRKNEKTMSDKLAFEIMDAFNSQGEAFKQKENIHKMAEANKAFSHFRF
ncbi:30S ribosomal protein S7 [Blattabacterium cuenoti]|uniref:30S ribosomal protein S7 n=1 Tax=Blattabacterium cuenoti TaxID=1653831 RepID=UPI00163D09B3|nr:30S ribosomal protein S7 [Blattabacterium cuenoti]